MTRPCTRIAALKPARYLLVFLAGFLLAACRAPTTPQTPTPSPDPVIALGRRVFQQHCAACHALTPDTVIVGPSLAGIATRAGTRVPGLDARRYIELSILRPGDYVVEGFPNAMPSDLGKKMTGEEFDALVAFLMTLR